MLSGNSVKVLVLNLQGLLFRRGANLGNTLPESQHTLQSYLGCQKTVGGEKT